MTQKVNKELSEKLQEVAQLQSFKTKKSYTATLEKMLANKITFQEELKQLFKDKLLPTPKMQTFQLPVRKSPNVRELVVMLNDLHLGLTVFSDEVNNVNSFNYKIACRRVAAVIEQAITYKPHNRNEYSKIHLMLNGDLVAGILHSINTKHIDLLAHQVNSALHVFTHSINALIKAYPKAEIAVHGVSGNHSDSPHKREGGNRVIVEKFDNVENNVFYALSWIFSNNNQVTFDFPKTPYALIDLPAGRAMLNHGDVFFKSLGNPGRNLNIKGLSEDIHKFSLGEIKKGKPPIELVLMGHVHVFANFQTFHGTEVYIAPSLSGTDAYAHSLNINSNQTGQVIFETTDKFLMGDRRLIRVSDADNRKELDQIIPTFKRTLKR